MDIYKLLLNEIFLPEKLRRVICCRAGITLDKDIKLKKHVFFEEPSKIKIGKNCIINHYVHFYTGVYNSSVIIIGDNVSIGFDTKIFTNSHIIGNENMRAGNPQSASVYIDSGVWIGANCTILPGVRIASGSVIAAGSVVTEDTEPNCLYAGVPARKKRSLSVEKV